MALRVLVILLLSILASGFSFGQDGDAPQEYLVKAKYLLNIPLFTELSYQANSSKSYIICVIGDTPLEEILRSSTGKQIKNFPLVVSRIEEVSQARSCQMLFIASSERHRLQTILPEAHRHGILTVSDMRDFARLGGIINLLTINNRVTFDLNLSAADKASISVSTHLLKLAREVIN